MNEFHRPRFATGHRGHPAAAPPLPTPAPPAPHRSRSAEGVAARPANMVVEGELMDPTTALPTGTVTFLFTDVEGSTRLWEQHPEAMQTAQAHHNEQSLEFHDT